MRNRYQSAGLWGVWLGALARWPGYVEPAASIASSGIAPSGIAPSGIAPAAPRPGLAGWARGVAAALAGPRSRGRRGRGADIADLQHVEGSTERRDPFRSRSMSDSLLQASASPLGSFATAKMPASLASHKPKPSHTPSKTATPTHSAHAGRGSVESVGRVRLGRADAAAHGRVRDAERREPEGLVRGHPDRARRPADQREHRIHRLLDAERGGHAAATASSAPTIPST